MSLPLSITSTVTLNSGYKIPLLGFGVFQSVSALASTQAALAAGYLHVDSARFYRNEAAVVKAAKDFGGEVFLTTKVQGAEHGTKATEAAVTDSIRTAAAQNLKWDLFLLHDPTAGPRKRLESWRVLERNVEDGNIKSIGVSNFGVRHLEEFKKAGLKVPIAVNQIELHPWCQQKPIVEYCKKEGIAVEAYCPIVRGKKFGDPTLKSIADRIGKTEAQVLIRWSLQKGYIPLVKSDTPSRIVSNADVYGWELDAAALKELDALDQGSSGAISWNPVDVN
ncbi:2,5-diketo-D-gluconic acid reductase A [Meredithblackwellia eburnea MCA 4105]